VKSKPKIQRKQSLSLGRKLSIAALAVLFAALIVWVTRSFWTERIGASLVCEERIAHSDGLLLENFDTNFPVFERAARLQHDGVAEKIFVPLADADDTEMPRVVSQAVLDVLARGAGLSAVEAIPIHIQEPISLNAANQIRDFLTSRNIKSVVVISPSFRSRRSLLIYKTVLGAAGIDVGCAPVSGQLNSGNWTRTWHGMQEVILQFLKLDYYRYYVLL